MTEVEGRRPLPPEALKEQEGALLLAAIPRGARTVALDEDGKQLTSRAFAERLGRWQDDGIPDVAFLIGGADGLSEPVRQAADAILSLGRLTRSEARRVGKECGSTCRSRWSRYQYKNNDSIHIIPTKKHNT